LVVSLAHPHRKVTRNRLKRLHRNDHANDASVSHAICFAQFPVSAWFCHWRVARFKYHGVRRVKSARILAEARAEMGHMLRVVSLIVLASLSVAALAQEPLSTPKPANGTLVREEWQAASIDGLRAGYVQLTVHDLESNGMKFQRASRLLSLTLKRFGDIAKVEAITGTDELPDGRVLGIFMRQGLGKEVHLTVRGVVQNNQLNVTAEGKMQFNKSIPWDPTVLGTLGELNQVGKIKPQPGHKWSYMIYEPIINALVKVDAIAIGYEELTVSGKKYNLLKITAQPQAVAGVTLPASSFWFDAKYEMIRSETIMPGLGKLLLDRTTRDVALQPCVGPDLGWRQAIELKTRLAAAHDGVAVAYRMRFKNDKDPLTVFSKDERQTLRLNDKGDLEITVQAIRKPPEKPTAEPAPGAEYTTNNNFITSEDDLVKRHSASATGRETDPWKKAKLIERWVHTNMKVLNFTEAMAPAGHVAKTLEGDCTEYSMLSAAMCRAAGVPSRTALGLVYVDGQDKRPPVFAMHMWTEVWVNGQWLGLDSTLGRGSIGPAHIKVTDHSWSGVTTMTPLMPLMRLMMSEPQVEIITEQRTRS
jgi:hypothetical protein